MGSLLGELAGQAGCALYGSAPEVRERLLAEAQAARTPVAAGAVGGGIEAAAGAQSRNAALKQRPAGSNAEAKAGRGA